MARGQLLRKTRAVVRSMNACAGELAGFSVQLAGAMLTMDGPDHDRLTEMLTRFDDLSRRVRSGLHELRRLDSLYERADD